eukprot:3984851-Pleurochrysis_carterae.AAC.2
MRIEFILASIRLLHVGGNLRLTASFLLWYMVYIVIAAIVGIIVDIVVNRFGRVLWVMSTGVTAIMLISLLSVGSVRMRAVLLREAGRLSEGYLQRAWQEYDCRAKYSASERLWARTANIISCSRQIRAASFCYIISMAGYYVFEFLKVPTLLAQTLIACTNFSLSGVQWAVVSCISTSMSIDQAHQRHAKTSSRPLHSGVQHSQTLASKELSVQTEQSKSNSGSDNIMQRHLVCLRSNRVHTEAPTLLLLARGARNERLLQQS